MTDRASRDARIERCLKNAEEAEAHAARCGNEHQAALFRQVADGWRELAEQAKQEPD